MITPGEVLEDYLNDFNLTIEDLAARSGLNKNKIKKIIKGKSKIDEVIAKKFANIFERPVHFWTNLEKQYQEDSKRLN